MNELILRIINLSCGYTEELIRNLSFEIRVGQSWFVMGPNGVGKSCLLKTIMGLCSPISGSLEFSSAKSHWQVLGYVPQKLDLNSKLPSTVFEFVSLGLSGLGFEPTRVHECIEQVGLQEHYASSIWKLSGGQKQRMLLARALVRRPRLLILDEPLAGLDFGFKELMIGILQQKHKTEEIATVFVSHSSQTAKRLATHFLFLTSGTIRLGAKGVVEPQPEIIDLFDSSSFYKENA